MVPFATVVGAPNALPPAPTSPIELKLNVPALTVVFPAKELNPDSVSVPAPVFVSAIVPAVLSMLELKIVLPAPPMVSVFVPVVALSIRPRKVSVCPPATLLFVKLNA